MKRQVPLSLLLPDVALPRDIVVSGLAMDSRQVEPGDAFVAIDGFGAHGLAYAGQARDAGAAAILFEPPAPDAHPAPADAIAVPGLRARLGAMGDHFHGHPSHAMTMVGVTGTNGKTSTVQLLAQAWHLRGLRSGSIGTLGAGRHGQVRPTGFTTPLVLRMHALLGGLRDEGVQAVAMEVSSHALDQGRVDGVRFDVAVFTNLTRDHLDYHGDMDAYGAAKARLFAWPGLKAAVLNLDDAYGRRLHAALAPDVRAVGISSRGQADARLRAEEVRMDGRGIAFELVDGGQSHPVRSPLLGRFNVDNLLAVAGVMHALGDAPDAIAATLSRLQPVPGRMNRLGGDGALPLVVIDYAHTPDALEQALESLRAHAAARLVCVFGCGGERDRGKRPQMARIAERRADLVIVTDDNPRGEDGDAIVADIVAGFDAPAGAAVERDRARAIARAIGQAGPDDIVLVAGKGHEPYQEVAGVRHPFDDTQVARAALDARAAPAPEGRA
ncbi:UDP-N-acetylmuramoyl-L-alanyl-D-glutamate--2,6-diaminopimelate ligase [Pseudoxanthomonas broegbernensis]|uniref:UDP-N-acetylmuramoyl-L-alanyl-D-glutamate--2,6-diaminopimelate ligase n=1 Tax=Pseudoxanthomonas broegbernensis TaxID=83619 RepID=A0A7V8GLS5_9GAMM|nr:UDP-N-acetylmuramoyl-L-alanyl-D-glutamate--2,6-diaminopimelate ligase [Pseudoxanthomonas broegbernensis]KAF1686038.1 UDP-N-acetylmuramoyl-L-alanyl-D-glutamate--2,6-diaminopimelate ligase [Pseudoxanthomonas broegbernensis]MBB6063705.1 UDP-N-acetylmuramoyl-L-alanyl-D-glutamate--2,6-diaminopimelate ligase [Pseudoxanthomonas broegbernensis]